MPFNEVVLTDSPINFNTVKQVNDALNTLIEFDEPFSSPVKKYVGHYTRLIICLYVCNTILEQENVDQKAILQARKYYLSDKGQVIYRKHLMM